MEPTFDKDAQLLETPRDDQSEPLPFVLKKRSFRGDGMVRDLSWPELRSLIYEGRGA